jgi:hypothetical protein
MTRWYSGNGMAVPGDTERHRLTDRYGWLLRAVDEQWTALWITSGIVPPVLGVSGRCADAPLVTATLASGSLSDGAADARAQVLRR